MPLPRVNLYQNWFICFQNIVFTSLVMEKWNFAPLSSLTWWKHKNGCIIITSPLCAQANSASYPQQDGKCVVATATG